MTDRLPVLYEDDDLYAVDKPEGLPVIPERIARGPCALEVATAQVGTRLYVVHRLDRDTSGVLLFAKNAAAHRHLNGEFEHRRARKTYAAVAEGRMAATDGKITAAIRPFGSGRMGVDRRRGKPCLTHYRVTGFAGKCTELLAHPVTGRRHQIRVHLHSLGHPVAGDRRYGEPLGEGSTRVEAERLMLHARSLAVRTPAGNPVHIGSELPASYVTILGRLRSGG
ncbi:MAG TPA: RluA family pseudouridine synthase [Candidatus Polarisedimenticolia bacterium]|jgi:RluA family pseudouridine synthase|nr:RluA family pseudouridine synthase [Candidatus Polarisedimenticolia bacterium]